MAYSVLLGIEHLMTGVQIRSPKGDVLTFHHESASVVRVECDSEINCYWPVKQAWMGNQECTASTEQYTEGEAEWLGQVMVPAMQKADCAHGHEYREMELGIPWQVVKAIRAKFGRDADQWIAKLSWDGLMKCWYFTYAGMFHGVEPDGCIHT